jgi:c-di-GMP-binding flagellar brake protein YcgR
MQNRRQYFRYDFNPSFYWKALFRATEGAASIAAEIVNLSVGGICVKMNPGEASIDERWIVTIALSNESAPLRIPVQRVHLHDGPPGTGGFRFLPLANATEQDEQEKQIWRFLLDAQRRDRRQANQLNWASAQ